MKLLNLPVHRLFASQLFLARSDNRFMSSKQRETMLAELIFHNWEEANSYIGVHIGEFRYLILYSS